MTVLAARASAQVRRGVVAPLAILVAGGWAFLALAPDSHALPSFAGMWLAMTLAMMLPTVARPMMRAAEGSALRGWHFGLGFVAVWLAAGIPGYVLMAGVPWTPTLIALLWVGAGAYQLTPAVQRLLTSCRSVRFEDDPARYGVRQGLRCLASCAPLMLAVMTTAMVLPGSVLPLALLLAATALLCWEKSLRPRSRSIMVVGVLMVALASSVIVLGVGDLGSTHHHASGVSTS